MALSPLISQDPS